MSGDEELLRRSLDVAPAPWLDELVVERGLAEAARVEPRWAAAGLSRRARQLWGAVGAWCRAARALAQSRPRRVVPREQSGWT